jgi:hypothetical protein
MEHSTIRCFDRDAPLKLAENLNESGKKCQGTTSVVPLALR